MRIVIMVCYTVLIGYFTSVSEYQTLQVYNMLETQIMYLLPAYLLFCISPISRHPYELLREENVFRKDLRILLTSTILLAFIYILSDNIIYILRMKAVPLAASYLGMYVSYLCLVFFMFMIIIMVCYTFFNAWKSKILAVSLTIVFAYILFILNAQFPVNIFIFNFVDSLNTFIKTISTISYSVQLIIDLIAIYILIKTNVMLIEKSDIL